MPNLAFDPRFHSVLAADAVLDTLYTGAIWSEGPVWQAAAQTLIWSDIPNNRMLTWHETRGTTVFRAPSHFSNGNTLDREGRMITCEHGRRCLLRTAHDGTVTVLLDRYQGHRLNSPNDVVVKSDGTMWFTDPSYGIMSDREGYKADSELGGHCYVFRFDPATGSLSIVEDSFAKPNGLAFSLDEKQLYVSDTAASHDANGDHHIRVFDVTEDSLLINVRLFAVVNPGLPDGFRLDTQGRLYVSSADSVQAFEPDGTLLGKIPVPEKIANCVFGGTALNELFIAASTSLYRIKLKTAGAVWPRHA